MEHFYTLQGEGVWSGAAAYFIRLSGCDVGCVWCDVKESWTATEDQWRTVAEMVEWVVASGSPRVVITGGEPTMYDLGPLTEALQNQGILTHIETSGTYPVSGKWDWICLSPKKFKPTLPEWYGVADELKVVVFNAHDLAWAEEEAAKCNQDCTQLFLQPEWGRMDRVASIIAYIKSHPHWQLSLQTHKFLEIP